MGELIDLTGLVVNDWKVLSKGDTRNRDLYWICECINCGAKEQVKGVSLRKGVIKQHCEKCPICGKVVSGKKNTRRKYCQDCVPLSKDQKHPAKYYVARAIKHQLVLYKGGKCEKCGYNKSENALHFHHIDPTMKLFQISNGYNLYGCNMKKFKEEADKCVLLCANCHAEEHELD